MEIFCRFAVPSQVFPMHQATNPNFSDSVPHHTGFMPIQGEKPYDYGDAAGLAKRARYNVSERGHMSPSLDPSIGRGIFRAIVGPQFNRSTPSEPGAAVTPEIPCEGVALSVTNLDYNITSKEWKKILYHTFRQYVQVIHAVLAEV